MTDEPASDLRERVEQALRGVIDPELGVSVVDLGLVYSIEIAGGHVEVAMTMTTPTCPLGEQVVLDAQRRLAVVPGISSADVRLVWDPPWGPERMSSDARRMLGWGG